MREQEPVAKRARQTIYVGRHMHFSWPCLFDSGYDTQHCFRAVRKAVFMMMHLEKAEAGGD